MNKTKLEENKRDIEMMLLSTGRKGIEDLIIHMHNNGFFESPCSGKYHLSEEGGLAQHSMNVLRMMQRLKLNNEDVFGIAASIHSIRIVALLHDLGKMGQYGKPNYVPNYLKGGEISTATPYNTNGELAYVPHEVRSLQIASRFIELTEEESFAILYHNGLYTPLGRDLNGKERKLQMILHFADMWVSRFVEVKKSGE